MRVFRGDFFNQCPDCWAFDGFLRRGGYNTADNGRYQYPRQQITKDGTRMFVHVPMNVEMRQKVHGSIENELTN